MGMVDKKQSVNYTDNNSRPLLTRMDMRAMPVALPWCEACLHGRHGDKDARVGHVFWGVEQSYGGHRIGPAAPCVGAR